MMENHSSHKVSRFFPSSFTSCRLRTLTDVVQSSISATRNRHENQFPKTNLASGDRVGRNLGYFVPSINGRRCPPATPISAAVAPAAAAEPPPSTCTTSSISGETETHRESDALFSFSSAVSSESPPFCSRKGKNKNEELISEEDRFDYYSDSASSCRRKTSKPRRKTTARRRGWTAGWSAIEKSTSDPYGEFRKSMMEMIVEKQIFRAEDLNTLLHCFLSLNSPFFHELIVEVYLEIIQTLFTN